MPATRTKGSATRSSDSATDASSKHTADKDSPCEPPHHMEGATSPANAWKRGQPKTDGATPAESPKKTSPAKKQFEKKLSASESSRMKQGSDTKAATVGSAPAKEESLQDSPAPRRSSRGVVPNSRFKDMELDFGRKKSKDEESDVPKPKRRKVSTKVDETSAKKDALLKDAIIVTAQLSSAVKRLTSASKVILSSTPASSKSSSSLSASTARTEIKSPLLQSQRPSPEAAPRPTPKTKPALRPTLKPTSTALRPSPGSGANPVSTPSSSTSSQPADSPEVVLVSAFPPSSTFQFPSTTAQALSQSDKGQAEGDAVSQDSADRTGSLADGEDNDGSDSESEMSSEELYLDEKEGIVGRSRRGRVIALEEIVLDEETDKAERDDNTAGDTVNSEQCIIVNTSDQSVTEVTLPISADADRSSSTPNSPSKVTTTPFSSSVEGKAYEDTPGRVINKSSLDEKKSAPVSRPPGKVVNRSSLDENKSLPASRTVYALNPLLGQSSAIPEDGSQSTVGIEQTSEVAAAPDKLMSEGGDVTSLVEESPNKKVPVVLGERCYTDSGAPVQKISMHQLDQLPQSLQQIVSSQLLHKGGRGAPDPSFQPQKPFTVQVTTQPLAYSPKLTQQIKSFKRFPAADKVASQDSSSEQEPSSSDSATSSQSNAGTAHMTSEERNQQPPKPPAYSSAQTGSASAVPSTENQEQGMIVSSAACSQAGSMSAKGQRPSIVYVDEDSDDDDEESEAGVPLSEEDFLLPADKYATSGTQTPYAKKSKAKSVVTITVHPPGSEGEKSEKVEGEVVVKNEGCQTKTNYIFVDIPKGTTIKQHFVNRCDRYDTDPNFYTMDEHGAFSCDLCDYQTFKRSNFYKHKKKHLGLKKYACDQCHYRAATSSNLNRHMEIHKDIRNHQCHLCSLHFRQKIHLERHIKYRHEEKRVKCPLCDYVCANENPDLKVHMKRRHTPVENTPGGVQALTCRQCDLVLPNKRDLRQHLKFHSKGPELKLFCSLCSFVTDCESRLRRHQYIHTKEKPYVCSLCNYSGSQKEHVLRHMRSQHNIEVYRKQRSKKNEKQFDVSSRSKAAERADYTSEEKIFACNHCTMKFSKLINLYKHLHTQHRDIMPPQDNEYSCVVCDFHTTSKKNLLVHMRRHNMNDQSPPSHVYSCVLCRYANPKRRNLFQHIKKKHHIDIVMNNNGSSTCLVSHNMASAVNSLTAASFTTPDAMVNVMPLTELITSVSQSGELHVSTDGSGSMTGDLAATLKMDDIALVVANPQSTSGQVSGEDSISLEEMSGDGAAEAIQGLQALAQQGVLEVVEEQVMSTEDQGSLVLDAAGLGVVEQLVQAKSEPLEVVELEHASLLPASLLQSEAEAVTVLSQSGQATSFQLSADQLMDLSTGDYLDINGEMFQVEVSVETNPDGSQGPHIISVKQTPQSSQESEES